MSEGNFQNADFRTANFLDTCLVEADCEGANFEGAYFSRTLFTYANLCKTQFSCPSLFTIDLAGVKTLEGAVYSHLGEVDCDLSHAPLIIRGLHKPLIFMDDYTIIGAEIRKIALRQHVLEAILDQTNTHKVFVNQ
ncbi:MAG: pentapeptide repeat-containing protein [Alphaproteobacteria bacterium]|nr:pentapeptide repeat-containing protein [Alphaproteobacteria bacterium]